MSVLDITYPEDAEGLFNTWSAKNQTSHLYIGVDIGGTNTRVALGNDNTFSIIAQFKSDSTRTVVRGLNEIAEVLESKIDVSLIKAACLDAAGRVTGLGTSVEVTNYRAGREHQMLSLDELPRSLFPKGQSRIINDLESACYGISGLNGRGKVNEFFKILLGPHDEEDTSRLDFEHYLVVSVGTGMGVGLLMALPEEDDFVVLPLEGGHILLSSTSLNSDQRHEEDEMLAYISCAIYGGEHSLEYEDLVSGRGLEALYKFFAHKNNLEKSLTAPEVSTLALQGDVVAQRALLYHYLFLARGTANLAVCLGAKGVFWAGSNQITNMNFVEANADALYSEFLNHPKKEWLRPLPIFAQKEEFNVNLEGTITVSRSLAKREVERPHFNPIHVSSCAIARPEDSERKNTWTTKELGGTVLGAVLLAGALTYFLTKKD